MANSQNPSANRFIARSFPSIYYAQVEDKLFHVPRCELVQSSQVFANMFRLPSGTAAPKEGQDTEHPIVLEGYKKDEFACLLKVMYPRYVLVILCSDLTFLIC